jgi:hypothetical protein
METERWIIKGRGWYKLYEVTGIDRFFFLLVGPEPGVSSAKPTFTTTSNLHLWGM